MVSLGNSIGGHVVVRNSLLFLDVFS